MKSSSFYLLLLFISLSINFISSESSNTSFKCGKVYDGLTTGLHDMNFQTSTSTIAANWFGFGDEVLFFEWAIVSDSFRFPFDTSVLSTQCIEVDRINLPDIMHWERLGKQTTSAVKTNLSLKEGSKYFVLLRVTYRTGHQLITMSDGVSIINLNINIDNNIDNNINNNDQITPKSSRDVRNVVSNNRNKRDLIRTSASTSTTSENCFASDFSDVCSIDNENRCRQDTNKRVSQYLNQIYGRAKFPVITPLPPIVFEEESRSYDDDDEDDADIWILAPVIPSVVVFLLLLCCLFWAFIICCGAREVEDDDEKDNRQDIGDIEDNLDGKDYGNRGGVNKADTATNTKVEFPDTNIRRLSVDHNDEEEVSEEVKGTRRKHPIASSASSSFRDYRSVNQ